ncbi:MAG: hypothetical protein CMJ95_10650 [Planctomycetes bacterium]|nr:hypothetical protein [Planctomycetota bacterium]
MFRLVDFLLFCRSWLCWIWDEDNPSNSALIRTRNDYEFTRFYPKYAMLDSPVIPRVFIPRICDDRHSKAGHSALRMILDLLESHRYIGRYPHFEDVI